MSADRTPAVALPPLGYGAAALGNLYRPISDAEATALVDAAWDAGTRYFDVAPHYGLGLAERRLGQALATRPRAEYLLSTKVGRLLEPSPATAGQRDSDFFVPADRRRVWDASEAGVRRSLAESSERTGIERFDVAFLHDPEEYVAEGEALDAVVVEGLEGLARLRAEGAVGAIGVGTKSVDALLAAVRTGLPDVVMLAGRYTLLEQPAAAELLPACLAAGVRVVAVGVFNSGALAEDVPRGDLPYEYGAMPPEVLERVQRLADLCRRHGTSLPTAALHFPLRHPAVASVVVGADTPAQVRQNVARSAEEVPESLWEELAALQGADGGTGA
ncbi:aldo/keto reductase [Microlunatus flavus]|uniref:D-threo-aldose 1-dehydrogenase n=1 Tax=Microlunatus flavus TaxID=1036181 RepID=A0A1H9B2T6_9ACTN|nr:aldo/keto reductase [Microlunatus flavus]SEP82973.1 D-threo-aldose 1-dehydrogenase [Microlunatus flavus]